MNAQAEHVNEQVAAMEPHAAAPEKSPEEIAIEEAIAREYLERERDASRERHDKIEALNDRHRREVEEFQRPETTAEVRKEIESQYKNLQAGARHSLVAQELARRQETLERRHLAERQQLMGRTPLAFARFLEQRFVDPTLTGERRRVAKRLHDEAQPVAGFTGDRTGDMSPVVLDGLAATFGAEKDGLVPVHYERDHKRVITDRGDRLDVHETSDQEIEAALRIAAQKFDLEAGLDLTGNEEFRTRAAEIAGRLGYKVQNPDLQAAWQAGSAKATEVISAADITGQAAVLARVAEADKAGAGAAEAGIGRAQDADAPAAARAELPRTAEEAQPAVPPRAAAPPRAGAGPRVNMAGEFLLQRLKPHQIRVIESLGRGETVPLYLSASLRGRAGEPDLVTEEGGLTDDGRLIYARLLERQAAEREQSRLEQQQLLTRNEDQALEAAERERTENAHDLTDYGSSATAEADVGL
ncbi:MAG: LPD7 domain-containing protein [Steroidobacteraceae bacterium]